MKGEANLIDDCFLHDKDRLRHDEALTLLRDRLGCVVETEKVTLSDGFGRVLADNVQAPHAVPLHTNSAVDGYAFAHASLAASPPQANSLPISQRIAAGDLAPPMLAAGTAARIFTGATMPEAADTVAMQEDCTEQNGHVVPPRGLKAGANCRKAGEDLMPGDVVATAGTRLRAADLAALTSIGCRELRVYKRLRIALFSNGNEMRRPQGADEELRPGEVYDANVPLITALAAQMPIDITDCGIIRDDEQAALSAIGEASGQFDAIVATGGASRGTEDHMLATLDSLGKRHLWQLAVKPGRPMMFGQIPRKGQNEDCIFFGLPGNPVAAMVCFLLYTRPALLQLAGCNWSTPHSFQAPADFEIATKKADRREFSRGILATDSHGTTIVRKFERDGSGLISSLRLADGLINIPEEVTQVARGDMVTFLPFNSFT